jgi:hypothetical protein
MYVNDAYFCDTLEDTNRDLNKNGRFDNGETKVYGGTCIPFGHYTVDLTMSAHFKRVLPILVGVPDFAGVRIHRGNEPSDTLGCILVGENKIKGKVINSTPYEEKLVQMMKAAKGRGETISITIK